MKIKSNKILFNTRNDFKFALLIFNSVLLDISLQAIILLNY